jgi:hypothetical protein
MVQYLEPFAIDGVEQIPIVCVDLMDERNLVAVGNSEC